MARINDYISNSYYDNNGFKSNANSFFSDISVSTDISFSVSDYASIKDGSYGKLLKAYYKQQKAEKTSSSDGTQKLTLMQTSAGALAKSVQGLMNDSLWEKKTKTEKDEKTGEEKKTSDYDWDAIIKAVKFYVDDYNDTVKQAGESNTKGVLRNAAWMTSLTSKNENMLSKVGITVGKGNTLTFDEKVLKKADISTLKSVFTGYNSYVSKISKKATSISNEASRAGGTYTSGGTYTNPLASLVSSKVDKEV